MSGNEPETKSPETKSWFAPNRSGVGFHPRSWQGWLVIAGAVVVIACVIILLKQI